MFRSTRTSWQRRQSLRLNQPLKSYVLLLIKLLLLVLYCHFLFMPVDDPNSTSITPLQAVSKENELYILRQEKQGKTLRGKSESITSKVHIEEHPPTGEGQKVEKIDDRTPEYREERDDVAKDNVLEFDVKKKKEVAAHNNMFSFWSMIIIGVMFYRICCRCLCSQITRRLNFPHRRRNLLTNLRQAHFDALVNRLNRERAANGASAISRDVLALAFSSRDFNPNDYDELLRLNEENGNVVVAALGASEAEIERNPLKTLSGTDVLNLRSGEKSCPICLESYKANDAVRTIPCFHQFHSRCVDKWLRTKATYPICNHSAIG